MKISWSLQITIFKNLKLKLSKISTNDSKFYNECENITSLWMSNINDFKKSLSFTLKKTNNWKFKRQRKLIKWSISKQLLIVFNNMSLIIKIVYKYVKSTYINWKI